MIRILKYPLRQTEIQTINLPSTWDPIRFANQRGVPTIWAETDPSSEMRPRTIQLVFTGDEAPAGYYVGTAEFDSLVIHCYVEYVRP